jgi:hypothetical protein
VNTPNGYPSVCISLGEHRQHVDERNPYVMQP